MKKELKKNSHLTTERIGKIEIATNTDDDTIAELLAEEADPNYKFPYSEEFVKMHNLRGNQDSL